MCPPTMLFKSLSDSLLKVLLCYKCKSNGKGVYFLSWERPKIFSISFWGSKTTFANFLEDHFSCPSKNLVVYSPFKKFKNYKASTMHESMATSEDIMASKIQKKSYKRKGNLFSIHNFKND
jgi:hypothetical protein